MYKTLIASAVLFSFNAQAAIRTHFNLAKNQTETIKLASNPTTGYSWYPSVPLERNPFISVTSKYEADETDRMGASGFQVWEITGNNPGKTSITFEYKRSWEKEVKPVKTKKFTFTVK
jgi:predicted secreted protein